MLNLSVSNIKRLVTIDFICLCLCLCLPLSISVYKEMVIGTRYRKSKFWFDDGFIIENHIERTIENENIVMVNCLLIYFTTLNFAIIMPK